MWQTYALAYLLKPKFHYDDFPETSPDGEGSGKPA